MTENPTLRELRKKKNLTEHAMARLAGMSRPGIRKVEAGETTTTATLQTFARILETDLATVVKAWEASRAPKEIVTVNTQFA